MSRVGWVTMLVQLAAVETVDKQAQGTLQRMRTARKTTRRPGQTSQVVSQFGIAGFDRIGVCFASRDLVSAEVIPQVVISLPRIAVIVFGFGRCVDQRLDGWLRAFPDHFPAQKTARVPVDDRQDEDPVFLLPIKVNNSSISAALTSLGKGASGKPAAWALTHKETVRW